MAEAVVRVTRYEVGCLPDGDINATMFAVAVEHAGHGRWAVRRYGRCLDIAGRWDWEPIPSEREDDWLDQHRFRLDVALELAKAAAPQIVVNGFTVDDVLARRRG